jgi:flagellar protein FlbT
MPLSLKLSPHEQLFVNGAIICNGAENTTITFTNFAHILRAKDVLNEADAHTPVERVYIAVQTLLLQPPSTESPMNQYRSACALALAACGNSDTLTAITDGDHQMRLCNLYGALTKLRPFVCRNTKRVSSTFDGKN